MNTALAQVTVTGSNAIDCAHPTDTLTAHVEGDAPINAGVTSDDIYSIPHNIGFTFNYYGNNYTQCLLGANGTINFNLSQAGMEDDYHVEAPLLGNSLKYNNICGPWCDIDIFYSTTAGIGTETYSTDGVAPYRKFVVTWCNCQMFSCGAQRITTQIILYETTNIIEVHIAQKQVCAGWEGGHAIVGVQNATGTAATTAPGRDYPSVWTVPPTEAWRFTPAGTTSYTVGSIPYAPVPLASSVTYWYNATTGAYIGTGDSIIVSPSVTTTYKAGALGCADTSFAYITVAGSVVPALTLAPNNPSLCGVNDGSIVIGGLLPGASDTLNYTLNGIPQTQIIAIVSGAGTITLTSLPPGVYANFIVKQQTCTSPPAGPVTLGYPPISISSVTTANPSTCGGGDGSFTVNGLYPNHVFTINYTFNGVAQTPVTVVTNSAGSATILTAPNGSGTYANIVASFGDCVSPPMGPYTEVDPPISITSVSLDSPSYCGLSDGRITLSGLYASHVFTINYSYNGVVQTPITLTSTPAGTVTIPNLHAGAYTNFVASFGTCITPPVGPYVLYNPLPPPLNVISSTDPTQCGYCNGSIVISALPAYTTDTINYTNPGGAPYPAVITVTQADSTVHLPGICAGGYQNFTIKVGECLYNVAGNPTLTTTPITAGFDTLNVHRGCHGDTANFINSSQPNPGATLSYVWDFGDGTSDTSVNPSHVFAQGSYTVTLIATNHYCSNTISIPYSFIHPLQAAFIDTPNILCQGESATFINTTIGQGGDSTKYLWNFGDGSAMDTNINHIYNQSGVYTISLVATNWIPCQDTAMAIVYVDTNSGAVIAATDTVICEGTYITFHGLYSNIGNTGVSWNFGDGDSLVNTNPVSYAFHSAGTYTVKVNALYRACRDISATRDIVVVPQPYLSLGQDTSICPGGEPLTIKANYSSDGGGLPATWLWNTGETGDHITVTAPGTYYATVNINNCYTSDTVVVRNDCYMSMPNVFTPNGDGVNDYFFPRQMLTRGLTAFHMNIYNRWGQMIFETSTLDGRGWDGKLNGVDQPEGVYVYIIDATFKDGQKEHHQGNVTLLR